MPAVKLTPRTVYAILDADLLAARGLAPLDVCDVWLEGGIRLIQLRAKGMASGPMLALAEAVLSRTRAAGAQLIINDRVDIAVMCGADGVHVGQDDLTPAEARGLLGPSVTVGLSTHTDAQLARAAGEPVSYVAVGPVFGTSTKDTGYEALGVEAVSRAAAVAHAAGKSVVAIGGITRDNAPGVWSAGADSVAVISDLVGASLPETAARVRAWIELR